MEIEIDEATKAKVKYCEKDFACLINPSDTCCEVFRAINGLAYYVMPANDDICPYAVPTGNIALCNCPVRREIYNRYNM